MQAPSITFDLALLCSGCDNPLLMDMEPDFRLADPQEGTHRGGMLRPSMHPIKPQHALPPCCAPQHPTTPPQPIMSHRWVSTPTGGGTVWSSLQETAHLQPNHPCMTAFWHFTRGSAMASATA